MACSPCEVNLNPTFQRGSGFELDTSRGYPIAAGGYALIVVLAVLLACSASRLTSCPQCRLAYEMRCMVQRLVGCNYRILLESPSVSCNCLEEFYPCRLAMLLAIIMGIVEAQVCWYFHECGSASYPAVMPMPLATVLSLCLCRHGWHPLVRPHHLMVAWQPHRGLSKWPQSALLCNVGNCFTLPQCLPSTLWPVAA